MTRVLILGAGGHGLVVAHILAAARSAGSEVAPIGFLDDNERLAGRSLMGLPILGPLDQVWRQAHDALLAWLAARGIPSRPYFTPIHLQPFYVDRFGYRVGDFPIAEQLGRVCLALPFSGVMTRQQVEYVAASIRAWTEADPERAECERADERRPGRPR